MPSRASHHMERAKSGRSSGCDWGLFDAKITASAGPRVGLVSISWHCLGLTNGACIMLLIR
ncbi:hypothetical protein N657DRAFT_176565 [Parathielavia appendiculata]|uniref:Uncharacterized protein n=1 Tax=Parathielavia appendiculata TaxID=2587402 RepID=A0AAN6Z5U0_9PEZI|nr:hypothetical protein N657DRAFT_176565 [Parathielavia appendiculata]